MLAVYQTTRLTFPRQLDDLDSATLFVLCVFFSLIFSLGNYCKTYKYDYMADKKVVPKRRCRHETRNSSTSNVQPFHI